jgi:alpha-D-ribose 1-methylphosphonate 5-triphosphate diphosphatase
MRTLLKNAKLVLEDRIVEYGSLVMEGSLIVEVNSGDSDGADRIHDCQGHYLLPGLVDLHCDVIERDVEVRPEVFVPTELAIREADRRNAACGITTQFHGLSFGHNERGLRDDILTAALARAIRDSADRLLVDNKILLRCEVGSESAARTVATLAEEGCCDMISFMDHGRGAGTYRAIIEAWRSGAGDDAALARLRSLSHACARLGIPMGSHDDYSVERIAFLRENGIGISEFPKTIEVAREAARLGLCAVVGGPNAVRGESHLKWMAAADAVRAGVAGAICSDYHPTILPQAIFRLHAQNAASLPAIVRCATLSPARAAGLRDRGVLESGKRADIAEFALDGAGWARTVNCWSAGRHVCGFPDIARIVHEGKHSRNEAVMA